MQTPELEFKSLSASETAACKNEMRELALRSYGTHFHKLGEDGANALRTALSNDETWEKLFSYSHCFVSTAGEKIVGMAFLVPGGNPWKFFEAEWSYIRMVGVLPEYEGGGIGRRLTEMCMTLAKQRGEKTIALHTSEFMDAARHLYESLGFTKLKEIEPQWGKRYWIYTLQLNAGA